MGTSLAFHIVFAVLGMGLPVLLLITEGLWLRNSNPVYMTLVRRWSKGFAILFAVGAVSGTILSFELGLLWPVFMRHAGGIIGLPFSAEGFAFFIEAIFLGLYLYGWDRLSPVAHWLTAFPIAISGTASAIFVISANAWMNSPAGFRIVNGQVVDVDPVAATFNSAWFQQSLHMVLAAYIATGLAVAGIYAWGILRGRNDTYHRAGLTIAIALAAVFAPLQPISGDFSARWVADNQPPKLAALEGQFQTEAGAGLSIGGWPDAEARQSRFAIRIPRLLSLLAYHDPNAVVRGLDEWPRADQPDPRIVHVAFQIMVGIGLSAWAWSPGTGSPPGATGGIALPNVPWPLAAPGTGRRRAAGVRGYRVRLDGDRGWSATLDYLPDHAHQRGGDASSRPVRGSRQFHPRLYHPRHYPCLAPHPPRTPAAAGATPPPGPPLPHPSSRPDEDTRHALA